MNDQICVGIDYKMFEIIMEVLREIEIQYLAITSNQKIINNF